MAAVAEQQNTEAEQTTLALEGMTCASCAARIERSLNKLDGVEATVNYATEIATVSYDPALVAPEALVGAVEKVGYHASTAVEHAHEHEARPLPLLLALVLSVPLMLLAMVTPLRFGGWEWVSLVLATPVVFWAGLEVHRALHCGPDLEVLGVGHVDGTGQIGAVAFQMKSRTALGGGDVERDPVVAGSGNPNGVGRPFALVGPSERVAASAAFAEVHAAVRSIEPAFVGIAAVGVGVAGAAVVVVLGLDDAGNGVGLERFLS